MLIVVVFGAIVVSVLAQRHPSEFLCSVNATGKANITNNAGEFSCRMLRVGSFARYFLFDENQTVVEDLLVRPDLDKTFLVWGGSSCSVDYISYSLIHFEYAGKTDEGLFQYSFGSVASMFFDTDEHLVRETIAFEGTKISIEYTSVDYDSEFSEEESNLFIADEDACGKEAYGEVTGMACPKFLTPTMPGCAFEIQYSVWSTMISFKDYGYGFLNQTYESVSNQLFCNVKNKYGQCLHVERFGEVCSSRYVFFDAVLKDIGLPRLAYVKDPEEVYCPDNSAGCKKYCNYLDSDCVVVDKKGRYLMYEERSINYTDYVPSAEDFKSFTCERIPLEAIDYPCSHLSYDQSDSILLPSSSDRASNVLMIVGIAVGATLLVIVLVVLILFVTPLRKKIFPKSASVSSPSSSPKNEESSDNDLKILLNGEEQKMVLTKEIGKGGFGTVWLGEVGELKVAVKEMERQIEEDELDFKKEMDIMSQLHSRFVVRVFGSAVRNQSLFMVMEYVPLGSLSTALANNSFSPYLRCRYMLDVARGMKYLHSQGVIHRDLKPGNVLVCSMDPKVEILCKITDFGESRKTQAETTQTMTMTRGIGSPFYMAPEMMRGEDKYTRAVDIYSFGIMITELWNEKAPYSEVEFETPFAFSLYVLEGNRPAIREDCPQNLVKLARKCFDAERNLRPPFNTIVKDMSSIVNDVEKSTPKDTVHVKPRHVNEKGAKKAQKNSEGEEQMNCVEIPLSDLPV